MLGSEPPPRAPLKGALAKAAHQFRLPDDSGTEFRV